MISEGNLTLPDLRWSPTSLQLFAILSLFSIISLELLFWFSTPAMLAVVLGGIVVYLVAYRRVQYMDPLTAFSIPWITVLLFSLTPMSEYAIPINRATYRIIILALLSALIVSGQRTPNSERITSWLRPKPSIIRSGLAVLALDGAFYSFTVLNVLVAGYVPLIRGVMTGDSGYLDFGAHGVYGFYLAFANAWGIFHLVLYLRTGRAWNLIRYFSVILIFIAFVTRQNILSLAVESAVVYSLLRKPLTFKKLALWLIFAGTLFSIIGSFRSGSIKRLANIRPEYMWVPDPFIWVYSYSYFNVANVNNLVRFSDAPYYNGSSLSQLLPSFLRPAGEGGESYLEVANFNVSSYLSPVYGDMGLPGVVILTGLAIWRTTRLRKSIYREASLSRIGAFATLYFCAAFSFFINFWFYLPVIFQMVFFKLMSNVAERAVEEETRFRSRI
jgi:oligosaccharide repeat unit polymerase